MIRNVNKLLKKTKLKKKQQDRQKKLKDAKPEEPLYSSLSQNIERLQSIYENCSDVVFRPLLLFGQLKAMIIYIDGLSDTEELDKSVLKQLMKRTDAEMEIDQLLESRLPVSKVQKVNSIADCISSVSMGNPVLLFDGGENAISLGLPKWEKRSIEEPGAEAAIRGPREGFTESLQVSTSQLRRIIKSPALKLQSMKVGNYTRTTVALAYIEGVADPALVEEAASRLKKIEMDGVLESDYIEEMIEDNPYSPFPQLLSTERPDVACAHLLEGRVVILVEGTPFTLIAPISFFSLLQSHEDYYQRFMVSTFIRWLRYLFLGVALLLPAVYVAVTTFHQEMVPSALLLSIAASREVVPFPALVEVLLMEITFEALREAGARLPKQIGSAVSIVGALVIGQASVQAGLVSAPMVIVVAITGIASFMIPRYIAGIAIRMLRFPLILLASTLGLLGLTMGIIAIVIHLCGLRSFGEPYLSPLAPLSSKELKDALWRSPWWMMNSRPRFAQEGNMYRQAAGQSPNAKKQN